jgi:hypothetical protein
MAQRSLRKSWCPRGEAGGGHPDMKVYEVPKMAFGSWQTYAALWLHLASFCGWESEGLDV